MADTTVHIRDELFTVDYWRNEFQILVLNLGRNWRKEVKSVDPNIDSSVLDYVKDGRGGLDNTRRVVLALQRLAPEKAKKRKVYSSRQKLLKPNK